MQVPMAQVFLLERSSRDIEGDGSPPMPGNMYSDGPHGFEVEPMHEEDGHPKLDRLRRELKQQLDWAADQLKGTSFPQSAEVQSLLRRVPSLPSEQVMPALKRAQQLVWQGKQTASKGVRRDTGPYAHRMKQATGGIEAALMALMGAMKSAAQLSSSARSDAGLYQTKVKGYMDNDGQFHTVSASEEPTEGLAVEGTGDFNWGMGPQPEHDVSCPPEGRGPEPEHDVGWLPQGNGLEPSADVSPWATAVMALFNKDKDTDPDPPGLALATG